MESLNAIYAVTVLLVLQVSQVEGQTVRQRIATKYPNRQSDVIFANNLLMTLPASTRGECAVHCASTNSCVSFTYQHGEPATCKGYNTTMTSPIHTPLAQEPNVYAFGEATVPTWLGKDCTANADCPDPVAVCFQGKCLCTPGRFYWDNTDKCVNVCVAYDHGSLYSKFSGCWMDAPSYIRTTASPVSLQDCLNLCQKDGNCYSFDYVHTNNTCVTRQGTKTDVPNEIWITGSPDVDHYQRSCFYLETLALLRSYGLA